MRKFSIYSDYQGQGIHNLKIGSRLFLRTLHCHFLPTRLSRLDESTSSPKADVFAIRQVRDRYVGESRYKGGN